MKFMSTYQRVLPLWSMAILITDGYSPDSKNEPTPSNVPDGGDKYVFPSLYKAWDDAEDAIDPINDAWGDMFVWSMFQTFQKEAKRLILIVETHIKPTEIPLSLIEERFRENLNTKGWECERDTYDGL